MMKRRHSGPRPLLFSCTALLLYAAGCGRPDTEPQPAPLTREAGRDFEVLERVRQKRAPGEEITRIGHAVEQYQVRYGQLPENVSTLVRAGLLPSEPTPPEGLVYVIDPLTGNVALIREIDLRLRRPPAQTPRP